MLAFNESLRHVIQEQISPYSKAEIYTNYEALCACANDYTIIYSCGLKYTVFPFLTQQTKCTKSAQYQEQKHLIFFN